MAFGDAISGFANGLGNTLFPTDPSLDGAVDPATAAAARNQGLIRLGLGIMQAPYNMQGLGAGLLGAYNNSTQGYQNAMDRAFHNTVTRQQLANLKEDRDFLQQERAQQLKTGELGLKQAERNDRTQAATVAQRVLKGLAAAPDKNAYLGLISNDPDVKDAFSTLGIQPPYAGPMAAPGNLDQFTQQLSTAASAAPAPTPIVLKPGEQVRSGTDPTQVIAQNAPLADLERITRTTSDGKTQDYLLDKHSGQITPSGAPYATTAQTGQDLKKFSADESQLMGALAERGVSLPAGLRGQQQMKETFRGLLDRNPGRTPDEVADLVRTGQLDFNGAKKSTAQLMTQSAAANVQASKLEKDFAQLEPLIAKLPDAPNIVNRALVGLKNNLSFGGDKDSAQLVLYMREAATEYAKLSSGSTGSAAPAEGNIKEAVEIFHKAFTEGGYQGLKEAMIKSAQNKRDAVQEGLKAASRRGASTGDVSPETISSGAPKGADGKPLW